MLDAARHDRLGKIKELLLDADRSYRRMRAARSAGDYPTAAQHQQHADRLAHEASMLSMKSARAATER